MLAIRVCLSCVPATSMSSMKHKYNVLIKKKNGRFHLLKCNQYLLKQNVFFIDFCSPGELNCLHTDGCTVDKNNISTCFCENGFELDTDLGNCTGN